MNYSQYVTRLVTNMAGISITDPSQPNPTTDPEFNNFLPEIIDYAEQRIYRELDFLATRTTDVSQATVSGSRNLPIPSQLVVIEALALLLGPANRVALVSTTLDALDAMWPNVNLTQTPQFGVTHYAVYDQQGAASQVRIAPTPDNAYVAEFRGTFRPAPMSSSNQNSFLGTYLPDLFFTASMIHASDYMRNFGTGDTPGMAQEWESQYNKLKTGAAVEELRKKRGQANTPVSPGARSAPQASVAA